MTALMVSVIDDTSKIVKFINNAREMGIKILNPDVRESNASFSIPALKTIRFGISALKGVGNLAANAIIDGRKKKNSFNKYSRCLRYYVFTDYLKIELCFCNLPLRTHH
jgi:DNA polymerase-3 subunit alpha